MSRLTELREQKLELEIQEASQQLEYSKLMLEEKELELAVARDKERDRQASTGLTRRVNFFGPVSERNVDTVITALEHWEIRDPGSDIEIAINSQGGSVTDGLALYDTIQRLRRKGHKVTTRGTGLVASMGAVLLQAGDERVMDARAKMLIHEGSTTFRGDTKMTAAEAEDHRTFSLMLREDLLDILSERSTLSREELREKWERRDWWLRADEALEYGFVDRVE